MEYIEFLRSKMAVSIESGFKVYLREAEMDKLSPTLFDFMEEQAK